MTRRIGAEDRFAIHDLLMEYVYASDTGDARGYANTFTPDGVLVTSDGERIAGTAAILAYAERTVPLAANRGRQHWFQQIRVAPEGAAIRVFSFWQVAQMTANPRACRVRSIGSCDDLCVRAGEGFRFAERRIGRWTDEAAPWVG
jgi:uncharacterized protein (TIGR02246 family)